MMMTMAPFALARTNIIELNQQKIDELTSSEAGLQLEHGDRVKLILELDQNCNNWAYDGTTASGVFNMIKDNRECNYASQEYEQSFVIKGDCGDEEGARGLFYL